MSKKKKHADRWVDSKKTVMDRWKVSDETFRNRCKPPEKSENGPSRGQEWGTSVLGRYV